MFSTIPVLIYALIIKILGEMITFLVDKIRKTHNKKSYLQYRAGILVFVYNILETNDGVFSDLLYVNHDKKFFMHSRFIAATESSFLTICFEFLEMITINMYHISIYEENQ